MEPRIGVYICHCGSNIAGKVDVEEVARFAGELDGVVAAREYKFMCSDPGQNMIKDDIKNLELNRVVVASCSPTMHEPTFRRACQEAGINPYLFEMANIREHCSWIHLYDKEGGTDKAKDLVRMAVAKVRLLEPQEETKVPVETTATVRHLLRDAALVRRYSDVRAYTSQGPSRLEVLASEQDPAVSEAFSELDNLLGTEKGTAKGAPPAPKKKPGQRR